MQQHTIRIRSGKPTCFARIHTHTHKHTDTSFHSTYVVGTLNPELSLPADRTAACGGLQTCLAPSVVLVQGRYPTSLSSSYSLHRFFYATLHTMSHVYVTSVFFFFFFFLLPASPAVCFPRDCSAGTQTSGCRAAVGWENAVSRHVACRRLAGFRSGSGLSN
ncbi:hypothetical protein B0T19DRAFT_55900 [Cercophora scortea]|uniref:Uncharacterized protein n=1 Tax=Cercophora scortea TaxID=314031 RepID=A0AAE0J657_9PEZI|nr:hypothetical protein B0T19DRAFT_55900 [Cercophora scortea]